MEEAAEKFLVMKTPTAAGRANIVGGENLDGRPSIFMSSPKGRAHAVRIFHFIGLYFGSLINRL